MLINYELLRTLLETGTAPTFADAAKRRHVTPSAISQQIKTLEAQLGVALFERVGRRARLTPAGQSLVAELSRHFGVIDDALAAVVDDHATVRGVVTIGAPGPFSRMWLRPRIVALLAAHPDLVIDARFGVPSALTRQLVLGECDFCILVNAVDAPSLEAKAIHTEEFIAVASKAYLRANGKPRTALEFEEHRYVVFDADLPMQAAWWRAHFGPKAKMPTRIACRIASLDEMLALAEEGIGVAVLPNYFVKDALAAGKIVELTPDGGTRRGRGARNPIHLAWRKAAADTARFRAVRDALLA